MANTPKQEPPQSGVFRLFWYFLPDTSVLQSGAFRIVVLSRFLSNLGLMALTYGLAIAVARSGASPFEIALIGVAGAIPAATLGLFGGVIADALPTRLALMFSYAGQAILCFVTVTLFGITVLSAFILVFTVTILALVSQPGERAAVPLTVSTSQLASAAVVIAVAHSVATGLGVAFLGPALVKVSGGSLVAYVASGLLGIAAIRVLGLPKRRTISARESLRSVNWRDVAQEVRPTLTWLVGRRGVSTMILTGVFVASANSVFGILLPRYVGVVLHLDPADTVFVFVPSAIGFVLAMAGAPRIIAVFGERFAALAGLLFVAGSIFFFGIIDSVSGFIGPISPLRLLELLGAELNGQIRAAGFLSLPLQFGVSLASAAVQTYVNRRVPVTYQGRTFALEGVITATVLIVGYLSVGGLASAVGVRPVLVVMPFLLLLTVYGLILFGYRFAEEPAPPHLEVLASFWEEPESAPPS